MNICPGCGRDLDKIPEKWKDFCHYDTYGSWCMEGRSWEEIFGDRWTEIEKSLDELAKELNRRFTQTINSLIMSEGREDKESGK